jgi:sulfate adenylyltransferase subunit 1 (EFTu-like GTPase family)
VVCDPYIVNRQTGGFILVDENSDTVAAGMIEG